jgi:glycine cleavage system transcriptional repressor
MKHWFILSAIGSDRPGLVAELAQLIFDCDANLEDSRMTILGTDFAVILLCSSTAKDATDRVAVGAKRLERDHGLTILLRSLEGGKRRVLADRGVNIAELTTHSRPGPGGSPHYELMVLAEVPNNLDARALREDLEQEGDRLVIDIAILPA